MKHMIPIILVAIIALVNCSSSGSANNNSNTLTCSANTTQQTCLNTIGCYWSGSSCLVTTKCNQIVGSTQTQCLNNKLGSGGFNCAYVTGQPNCAPQLCALGTGYCCPEGVACTSDDTVNCIHNGTSCTNTLQKCTPDSTGFFCCAGTSSTCFGTPNTCTLSGGFFSECV